MNAKVWLAMVLLVCAGSARGVLAQVTAQDVAAQAAVGEAPAYVNENQTDPAPLKVREVEGKVVGLGGDGMPRASVALFHDQGHTLVTTAMTDKDGKFRFNKVDKGMYRLVVRVAGLCPANVPLLVESSLLAHRKMVITMRAKDIDTCSYGMAK